jgi:hypothetical protein
MSSNENQDELLRASARSAVGERVEVMGSNVVRRLAVSSIAWLGFLLATKVASGEGVWAEEASRHASQRIRTLKKAPAQKQMPRVENGKRRLRTNAAFAQQERPAMSAKVAEAEYGTSWRAPS